MFSVVIEETQLLRLLPHIGPSSRLAPAFPRRLVRPLPILCDEILTMPAGELGIPERTHRVERVGFLRLFVVADAGDPRETKREAARVTVRSLEPVERDFEDDLWPDRDPPAPLPLFLCGIVDS